MLEKAIAWPSPHSRKPGMIGLKIVELDECRSLDDATAAQSAAAVPTTLNTCMAFIDHATGD